MAELLNKYKVNGDEAVIYATHKGKDINIVIDKEDLNRVKEFPNMWGITKTRDGLAVRGRYTEKGERKTIHLHRYILNLGDDEKEVIHLNGDKLYNRKHNLHVCTRQEVTQFREVSRNNGTGYRGISQKKNGTYEVKIYVAGECKFLGIRDKLEDAIKLVREGRLKYMKGSKEALIHRGLIEK